MNSTYLKYLLTLTMLTLISGHVHYPKFSLIITIYFKGFKNHCFICIDI